MDKINIITYDQEIYQAANNFWIVQNYNYLQILQKIKINKDIY